MTSSNSFLRSLIAFWLLKIIVFENLMYIWALPLLYFLFNSKSKVINGRMNHHSNNLRFGVHFGLTFEKVFGSDTTSLHNNFLIFGHFPIFWGAFFYFVTLSTSQISYFWRLKRKNNWTYWLIFFELLNVSQWTYF